MVAEVPLRVVTAEVILGEGRCRIARGVETVALVDAFLTRYHLRHDTESAIGELFDAPELLVGTSIGGNSTITFIFNPSEIASLELGTIELVLTYAQLKKFVKPAFIKSVQ